jgi:hypothetical protein
MGARAGTLSVMHARVRRSRLETVTLFGIAICVLGLATASASGAVRRQAGDTAAAGSARAAQEGDRKQQMAGLVHAWSARLNAGDNKGIAQLFSVPALITQGPYVYRLLTRGQVALWYSGLPCSGRIVSISYRGRFATAVFRLANRGATKCDQPGTLAAARFEIVGGKIVSWTQVPVPVKRAPGATVA